MYYLHKNENNKKKYKEQFFFTFMLELHLISKCHPIPSLTKKKNFIIQATAHHKVCISEM